MGYRFFPASTEALAREREGRRRLRALAEGKYAALARGRGRRRVPRRVRMGRRGAAAAGGAPAPPGAAIIALTRLGFGPRPGDVEAFDALGATDAERLRTWVDQQLDPASIDDSAAEARIAQSGFTTLGKTLTELWQDHVLPPDPFPWEERVRPFYETVLATFLRAVHSRRQLLEVMADFWHNHFNVYGEEFPGASLWPHTDRDVLRAHALGNFRQLLEAVAQSPPMLFYLDNFVNTQTDANENYAREMLELHTLGAEHYLGSMPQGDVPRDGQGRPIGYVEDDVVAAARCLTGWTVDLDWDPAWTNTGAFRYWDPWHDHAPKHVLGADLAANQPPMRDGRDLFDLVARHPGTARHIAGKLCRRLLGDDPPPGVVDAAAAIFEAQHAAPDQIAQVVRAIVLAPEFLATWGDKVKRPFEIAAGALRGGGGDLPFVYGDDATNWFLWEYFQTGQPLFGWHPPNGYPDHKAAWGTTSPRVRCWRLANMLVQVDDGAGNFYLDPLAQTPPDARSAYEIVTFWSERVLGRPAEPEEYDELVDFMAQGHNPAFDLPLDSDPETRDRLRALVALLFMTPSFLWR